MASTGQHYVISADGSALTIGIVQADDVGSYECIADNPAGRATAGAGLSLQPLSM